MVLPSQHMSRRSRSEISTAMLASNPRLNPYKAPAEAFLIQPVLLAHSPPPNSGTFSGQPPAVTSASAINYAAHSLSQPNKGHWFSIHVPKAGGRPQKSFPKTMEHRQAAKSPQSTQVQPSAINSRASPLPDPRIITDAQDRRPPRAILYALRFRFAPIEHCGRRENHLVILAVSYASADNFISSFLIASRLSSLCRNQCHSAQFRITN